MLEELRIAHVVMFVLSVVSAAEDVLFTTFSRELARQVNLSPRYISRKAEKLNEAPGQQHLKIIMQKHIEKSGFSYKKLSHSKVNELFSC